MSMPRGATVVDFAYMIHSNLGDHLVTAKINNQQVPLRTELKNGDIVEVMTAPDSSPNPSWLGFVRTGRARSRIRHHLKTMAHSESMDLGLKLLTQALRAEGFEKLPDAPARHQALWEKVFRFTGNKNRSDLLVDVGLGKRIASIVAKRISALLSEMGEKPDPLLMTRERFMTNDTVSQGAILQAVVAFGVAGGSIWAASRIPLKKSLNVLIYGVMMGALVMVMAIYNRDLLPDYVIDLGLFKIPLYLLIAYVFLITIGWLAGYFVVPMNALLQHRGHVLLSAGHSIAVQNFNENLSVLGMLCLYALLIWLDVPISIVIVMFGSFVCLVMIQIIRWHKRNQAEYDSLHLIGEHKHPKTAARPH
jgi:sulfur carrier protein ThiS